MNNKFYHLFTKEFDLQSTINIIQKALSTLIMISLYGTSYFHFVTIQKLIKRFKLDHKKFIDQEELKIIKKYTKQIKSYVYALMVFFHGNSFVIIFTCLMNICLHLIGKLDDNQLTLPVEENNVYNSEVIFYIMFIYQSIGIVLLCIIGSFSISIFIVFLQHACCQCNIIISKIRQPFKRNKKFRKNVGYFSTPIEEYNWIIDIINLHKKSLEYVKMLRCVSNDVYLIIVLLSMIIIACNFLNILQYSKLLESAGDKIKSCIYVVGSLFTVYVNFFLGQKLLNHSDAVFLELTAIPFYTLSKNTQKLLLFIIARSKKPCFLSIGNMFVSSHEVFSAMMRKAFSFAMVYYSIQ